MTRPEIYIQKKFNLAIVSGKGGTGKTLLSLSLAHSFAEKFRVNLFDLDVEEPNDHLFFPVPDLNETKVFRMIPVIDYGKCNMCGVCGDICAFHAIIPLKSEIRIFPELCHSCEACYYLCPQNAIKKEDREIGVISTRNQGGINLITGKLNIRETAAPAMINQTKVYESPPTEINIFDAPPGTSCSLVETVKNADFILVICEPTRFGLHDADLAVQLLQQMKLPFSAIVNKSEPDNKSAEEYCSRNNIEIIGTIPLQREIAELYAQGRIVYNYLSGFKKIIDNIRDQIQKYRAQI